MSAFWCPKCGDNLYGPDAETVAENHKKYCHPKTPKAGVINFDSAHCEHGGEETRSHMNNNQSRMCSRIADLKAEVERLKEYIDWADRKIVEWTGQSADLAVGQSTWGFYLNEKAQKEGM